MRCLPLLIVLLPALARAEDWVPGGCGAEPVAPKYVLTTREGYNDGVKEANAYQGRAKAYAACVLKAAHEEQTRISRAAQNRIADIQAQAVSRQQAVYARLAAQAATFKAAAGRLKEK